LAHAKTLGHNIQELLSDNGGEYDCEEVKLILSENGISQRLTTPYLHASGGSSLNKKKIKNINLSIVYYTPR
jgi:transposase InsO family protein